MFVGVKPCRDRITRANVPYAFSMLTRCLTTYPDPNVAR